MHATAAVCVQVAFEIKLVGTSPHCACGPSGVLVWVSGVLVVCASDVPFKSTAQAWECAIIARNEMPQQPAGTGNSTSLHLLAAASTG